MNRSSLNVLYQFDENYAPFAGVSLTTLFESNQDINQITVYLAAKDISEKNKNLLNQMAQQFGRELVYLNVEDIYQKIEQFGAKGWNGSLATWMKMFIMDELPESVDQLLYLDSDTLIIGSLHELAELDMGEYPVAAVIDSVAYNACNRLGLSSAYCNAGLIYFNLKYWRAHDVQRRMLECLQENVARYPVNDQDLLNDFFRNNILRLSPRYNFQGTHYFYDDDVYFSTWKWPKDRYYSREEIANARKDVRIIHFFRFCGQYPWQPGNVHPCQHLYEEARDKSLWKDYRYPTKPLKMLYRIEQLLYKTLPQKLFSICYFIAST